MKNRFPTPYDNQKDKGQIFVYETIAEKAIVTDSGEKIVVKCFEQEIKKETGELVDSLDSKGKKIPVYENVSEEIEAARDLCDDISQVLVEQNINGKKEPVGQYGDFRVLHGTTRSSMFNAELLRERIFVRKPTAAILKAEKKSAEKAAKAAKAAKKEAAEKAKAAAVAAPVAEGQPNAD